MLDKTTLQETTAVIAPVGFHLLKSEVVDLTPEYVKGFRAIEPTATERELSERRVAHLDGKINQGLAVTFHWVTADLAGKLRRVNGQHSSTMLARRCMTSEGKILGPDESRLPAGLKCHAEHFKVDDPDGLAMLFRQFDDRHSGRSALDVSGVYQGLHPELDSVNRKVGKLALDGYAWYQLNVEGLKNLPREDDKYTAFNDRGLWPLVKWLNDLFAVKSGEMRYPAVVAAIVGTYLSNESAAKSFWQDVVSLPNGDDEPTPQTLLSNWLIAIQAGKIDRPKPANIYQGCIHAWNAYRDGKAIANIRDDIKKNFYTIHE